MKILIDVDDELITRVLKESDLRSHQELVEEGLRLLLAQNKERVLQAQARFLKLAGKIPIEDHLEYSRRS
jgi:Arc/MetJ family transcription regulator